MPKQFDLIIKNGLVIDGTGNPWFKRDIGVVGGKIRQIGSIPGDVGKTIDADGMVVAPGFIDIHNHADASILQFPDAESYTAQGVTTLVSGNCGSCPAPVRLEGLDASLLERYKEFLPAGKPRYPGMITMAEFYEVVENRGIGLNLAPLVGHGAVRAVVKGYSATQPSRAEMNEMKKLVIRGLEDGAFGMSTGLIYAPGCFADTDELIELAGVLKKYGAIYASHIRNEGDKLLESVQEAIRIGEENNVPVQISHHKAAGKANWGKVAGSLELMEKARQRGVEVNCDVYPYTAGSTGIIALLPIWVMEGGVSAALGRLREPSVRKRIREDMSGRHGASAGIMAGWDGVFIAFCPTHKEYEGKSLAEILDVKKATGNPIERFFDMLLEINGNATIITFMMDEKDVRTVTASPLSCIASDGWAMAPSAGGKPHPRLYGTFPRVLARYVREEKLLTLEEAVRKMTSLPAGKLGLKDRGMVKEGFWADLVIFDPAKVRDKATYEDPHQYPEGINYVFVNGQVVVDNGKLTGERAGRVLKKTSR